MIEASLFISEIGHDLIFKSEYDSPELGAIR